MFANLVLICRFSHVEERAQTRKELNQRRDLEANSRVTLPGYYHMFDSFELRRLIDVKFVSMSIISG
jgi:hypothetical protein